LAQSRSGTKLSLPTSLHDDATIHQVVSAYELTEAVEFQALPSLRSQSIPVGDPNTVTPAEVLDQLLPDSCPESARMFDDGLLEGHRVAIVTNIPIHYRVTLFELVERKLTARGASLRVFFLSDVPSDRPWLRHAELGFPHEYVPSLDLGRGGARRLAPRGLRAALERFSPTIVLSAGFSPLVSQRIAAWSRGKRVFGIWSGEIGTRPTARGRLRKVQRSALVRKADFAIAYGWESARYLRSLRSDLPIVLGRNSTTVDSLGKRRVTSRIELLAVARAEREKALDLVIEAVIGLTDLDCRLTIVGDGPELPSLRAIAAGSDRVRFLGAVPHQSVGEAYAEADIFVFPSQYDIFGLVLVEAMAAGLAVITSGVPGAVRDLAAHGSNCIVVPTRSRHAWAEAIRTVVSDIALRHRLGARARKTIESRWTLDHAAEAMIAGFRLAALATQRKASN
jgi:glycosyltransferase involved in cell wall biosynthesis